MGIDMGISKFSEIYLLFTRYPKIDNNFIEIFLVITLIVTIEIAIIFFWNKKFMTFKKIGSLVAVNNVISMTLVYLLSWVL
jgi:hypothetical protein